MPNRPAMGRWWDNQRLKFPTWPMTGLDLVSAWWFQKTFKLSLLANYDIWWWYCIKETRKGSQRDNEILRCSFYFPMKLLTKHSLELSNMPRIKARTVISGYDFDVQHIFWLNFRRRRVESKRISSRGRTADPHCIELSFLKNVRRKVMDPILILLLEGGKYRTISHSQFWGTLIL